MNAGDIVNILNPFGNNFSALVMECTRSGNKSAIKCTGNEAISSPAAIAQSSEKRQYGKLLEISATADALVIEAKNLSESKVGNDEVRSKFALDSTSVQVDSGTITFNANTFILNSDNCKITADGTITASGSFRSANADGTWVNELSAGYVKITHNGTQRAFLFKAGNYDAAYLVLDGQFSDYTANAVFASDGVSINKNGALVAGIGVGGVSIKVPSALD